MHREQKPTESHEHPWRANIDRLLHPIVEKLHKALGLTPNQITVLGGALVALSALIPVLRGLQKAHQESMSISGPQHGQPADVAPDLPPELSQQENQSDSLIAASSSVLYVLGISMDKIDGVMAAYFAKNKLPHDSELGGLLDTLSDRFQEFILALSKIETAHQRGDRVAELLAVVNGISSMLPSFFRAVAESQGKAVAEAGTGLGILGTRSTRAALGLTAFYPQIGGVPVQKLLDALGAASNLITAYERARVCMEPNEDGIRDPQLGEDAAAVKKREKAHLKLKYQTPAALFFIAVLLLEYKRLNTHR